MNANRPNLLSPLEVDIKTELFCVAYQLLEFNVPFQHKYVYIRDETLSTNDS